MPDETDGAANRTPKNEQLRQVGRNVVDQRQQQIDPAGRQRANRTERPDVQRKQPGSDKPGKGTQT